MTGYLLTDGWPLQRGIKVEREREDIAIKKGGGGGEVEWDHAAITHRYRELYGHITQRETSELIGYCDLDLHVCLPRCGI